jgi:hypothetical protein
MNDLEDLLREELHARVAAAEAAAAGEQPARESAILLGDLDRRIRRARLQRRWTASVLSATAFAAAVALPLTLLSPGQPRTNPLFIGPHSKVPLSDPSLTPPGWSPLTYRDAQVSVPSSWVVQGPLGSVCGVTTHGGVLLGQRLDQARLRVTDCRLPATTVFVSPMSQAPRRAPTQRLNGIPVDRLPGPLHSVSYLAPSLGVELTALGPQARQVLATLTRSPRSVALAPGRRFPVPSAWRWHDYAGIRFAAPSRWRLMRTEEWGGCAGHAVLSQVVQLSSARLPGCLPVAMGTGLARSYAPVAGVTVGAGRLVTGDLGSGLNRLCLRLHGLRACVLQQGMLAGELLALVVFPHGRQGPTEIDIGLAGTGATARAILDSIRSR